MDRIALSIFPTERLQMLAHRSTGRIRNAFRQGRQFILHSVIHADDPPHRLALGAAIGIFIALTPTIGFQMLLVVFFAWLLRANKIVGLPIVWISNPATFVILYYPCYVIGRSILGREPIDQEWWRALSHPPVGWWPAIKYYWIHLLDVATPLWLGCLVVGLVLSLVTYYAVYHAIRIYRLKLRRRPPGS